jgi:hypothetical protein
MVSDTLRTNRDTSTGGTRRDRDAGVLLQELREGRYLTRREVPREMRKAGIRPDRIPHPRTLERIECQGVVPWERYRFGLAEFYERPVHDIWTIPERSRVAA